MGMTLLARSAYPANWERGTRWLILLVGADVYWRGCGFVVAR